MTFLDDMRIMYDNFEELYYNLFLEAGLAINPERYLINPDVGDGISATDYSCIKFNNKRIKIPSNLIEIYAGKNDILFEPMNNLNLMTYMFSYIIDNNKDVKCKDGAYIAAIFSEDNAESKQRVTLRIDHKPKSIVPFYYIDPYPFINEGFEDITSEFYYNIYLGYIECIFKFFGNNVCLTNFDIPPENNKK